MALTITDLHEEKALLQKDFDEMKRNITKIEMYLVQMKANMNAVNGAIQQTNRLITKLEADGDEKSKQLKETMVK